MHLNSIYRNWILSGLWDWLHVGPVSARECPSLWGRKGLCNKFIQVKENFIDFKKVKSAYIFSLIEFWHIRAFRGFLNSVMLWWYFRLRYACECLRLHMNEHDSIWTVHSIELKFGTHITCHRRTNSIDFGKS